MPLHVGGRYLERRDGRGTLSQDRDFEALAHVLPWSMVICSHLIDPPSSDAAGGVNGGDHRVRGDGAAFGHHRRGGLVRLPGVRRRPHDHRAAGKPEPSAMHAWVVLDPSHAQIHTFSKFVQGCHVVTSKPCLGVPAGRTTRQVLRREQAEEGESPSRMSTLRLQSDGYHYIYGGVCLL